jgi:repressor LexA
MSDFKNVITKLRKEQDLNQQEFADKLGVSKSTVSMWEIGERFPSKELYEQIADFFNVDIDYKTNYFDGIQVIYVKRMGLNFK